MVEKIKFDKEKISAISKVAKDYILDVNLTAGTVNDDFVLDQLTLQLDAWILSNAAEERILTYYCPRPTFFDWLFRRRREVKWELNVKDLLLNPPKLKKETSRIYIIREIE